MTNTEKLYKLFKIQCYDLLCLLDMERNGVVFNTEEAMKYARTLEEQLKTLLSEFHTLVGSNIPSITSNDDLSTVLYGGVIVETIRIPIGHYMSGAKKGEIRYKLEEIQHEFPRLVNPIDKTETAKCLKNREKYTIALGELEACTIIAPPVLQEYWEVNEPVLRSLKAKGKARRLIDIVLEYNKMEKLRGTYLEGYTKLIEEQEWEHNMLHGNFNQCVAITGRLSSSKP